MTALPAAPIAFLLAVGPEPSIGAFLRNSRGLHSAVCTRYGTPKKWRLSRLVPRLAALAIKDQSHARRLPKKKAK